MFTTGSKLLVGGAVAGDRRRHHLRHHAGRLARHGRPDQRRRSRCLLAGVNIYTRDADVSAMDTAALTESARPQPAPPGAACGRSSPRSAASSSSSGSSPTRRCSSSASSSCSAPTVEWMVQAWSERASADAELQRRRPRPHRPPAGVPAARRRSASPSSSTRSAGSCFPVEDRGRRCSPSSSRCVLLVAFIVAFRPSIAHRRDRRRLRDRRGRPRRRRRQRGARRPARDRTPRDHRRARRRRRVRRRGRDRGRRALVADGRRQGQPHGRAHADEDGKLRANNLGVTERAGRPRRSPGPTRRTSVPQRERRAAPPRARPRHPPGDRRGDGDTIPDTRCPTRRARSSPRRRQPAHDVPDRRRRAGPPTRRTRSSCPASKGRIEVEGAVSVRRSARGARGAPGLASRRCPIGRRCLAAAPATAPPWARRSRASLAGCAKDAPQDTWQPAGTNAQKIHNLQRPVFIIAGVVGVSSSPPSAGACSATGPRPGHPQADPRQARRWRSA